jgi:hypothetical protein
MAPDWRSVSRSPFPNRNSRCAWADGRRSLRVGDGFGPLVDVLRAKRAEGVEDAVVERRAAEQVMAGGGGDGVGHAGRVLEDQLVEPDCLAWDRLGEQRLELVLFL